MTTGKGGTSVSLMRPLPVTTLGLLLLSAGCGADHPGRADGNAPRDVIPRLVKVPSVMGATAPDARDAVRLAGLRVSVKYKESMLEDPGRVARQVPLAGQEVKHGHVVRLVVSKLPPRVPNVVGENPLIAQLDIEGAGFTMSVS